MKTRRRRALSLMAGVLAAPLASFAQQPTKGVRIGLLRFGDRATSENFLAAFKQGLRELGYVEGKTLALELRYADGKVERLPGLAAELVKLHVDIIVTTDTPAGIAAQRATTTIPIVLATASDPVGSGLVKSLGQPGGNITGLSNITSDISPKHVELLASVTSALSLVAVLVNPANPSHKSILKSIQAACERAGIKSLPLEADTPEKIESAFAIMTQNHAGAVIIAIDPFFHQQQRQIADLAVKYRLPSITSDAALVEAGLLMAYGQDIAANWYRAATYCDKILKGAKPGDLPVEQSTTLDLAINLKTSKLLGIKFPQSILVGASKVIE
jgi:putative ABC transport system substrate-binding protein